jgi:hypothetical protein
MIVKRVTNALKRQDWAAVAIEFILVVVGVLLAFQINEWATERQAGAERQATTERLLYETEDDVAYFRSMVEAHQESVRDLSYALDQMQTDTWREANRAQMQSGLTASVYLDAPSPPSSVYDDIVASGMLGKIGDPRLRSAISDYRAKLNLLSRLIDYIRQTAPKLDREDSLHYVYDAAGPRPARLVVDFAALAGDAKLRSSLALMDDRQAFILKWWRETLGASERMCRELGRKLGQPCSLNGQPAVPQ